MAAVKPAAIGQMPLQREAAGFPAEKPVVAKAAAQRSWHDA
jgi:hypothetical protein